MPNRLSIVASAPAAGQRSRCVTPGSASAPFSARIADSGAGSEEISKITTDRLAAEVASYVAARKRFGATAVRVPLTTEEAIALARTIEPARLRNARRTLFLLDELEALARCAPPRERAGLRAHLESLERLEREFWDAFCLQPFAGGEIVRRLA